MRRQHRQYPLLTRIQLSLFVLLLLYTVAVSVFTSKIFFDEIWDDACRSFEEDIRLSDQAVTSFFTDVNRIGAQLAANEPVLTDAMFRFPEDNLKNSQAVSRLKNTQVSYPYLNYVALYNQRADKLLSTASMEDASARTIKSQAADLFSARSAAKFTYFETSFKSRGNSVRSLSFVVYSGLSRENEIGAILVGVDPSFLEYLSAQNSFAQDAPVLLLDAAGKVLSGTGDPFPTDGLETYLEKIESEGHTNGHFLVSSGGERYVLCYSRNAVTETYLVQLIPDHMVLSRLPKMLAKSCAIIALIFCVGIAVAYIVAFRLLKPLYSFLSKYDYDLSGNTQLSEVAFLDTKFTRLTKEAEKSEALMLRAALHDLLLGQQVGHPVADAVTERLLSYPCYRVVLISFDEEDLNQSVLSRDLSALRDAVYGCAQTFLRASCEFVEADFVSSGDIVLVLASGDKSSLTELKAGLEGFRSAFIDQHQVKLCMAVSAVLEGAYDLNNGYLEAGFLMQQNFLFQKAIIFSETDYTDFRFKPFPTRLEQEIFAGVSANDPEKIASGIAAFFEYISDTNYEYAVLCLSRFVMDFFSDCTRTLPKTDPVPFQVTFSQIYRAKNIQLCRARIERLCQEMAEYRHLPEKKYPPVIAKALEITRQNYTRADFSVSQLTEALDLTTPYFNRVFKRDYGVSYGDYLNGLRVQHAKELLLRTDLPVSEIGASSGFPNLTYFYTLFKKFAGLTPAEFRADRKNGSE